MSLFTKLSNPKRQPRICLSFDVEEWRVPEHYNLKHPANSCTGFSRIGIDRLLDLFKEKNIQSTFFITGYYAKHEQGSVKSIVATGHEVGCHSYLDISLDPLTSEELTEHVDTATDILTEVCGKSPRGFRSPQFSGNHRFVRDLIKHKYCYDSSLHPAIVPGRYYHNFKPRKPFTITKNGGSLVIMPVAVMPILRLPISWWWMRNCGRWLTTFGTLLNLMGNLDVILYFHPWEFSELPTVPHLPGHITHKTGLPFLRDLEYFIDYFQSRGFEFNTIESLLD